MPIFRKIVANGKWFAIYFHSVSLQNFKSIGEDKSTIILEPRVSTIIGKNESGKSNVLEGLSYISLLGNMQSAFHADNVNRNNGTSSEILYSIILMPTPEDQSILGITENTEIIISKDSYAAKGGILTYYNEHIRESIKALTEVLGTNPFSLKDQDYTNYRNYITALQQEDSLHLYRINAAFAFVEARLAKLDKDTRDTIASVLMVAKSEWEKVKSTLPIIFYRKTDKVLKSQYKLDEVKKELENPATSPNSLLPDFVRLINISTQDFIAAAESGISGPKTTIRNRINRNVKSIVNKGFQAFYSVENISLNVDFNAGIVSFSVQSNDGEALQLSERSNGLRWYLNTFIDAVAQDMPHSNVMYLFDEPGTSLHVNAQKELINLFGDLADKGNQVVYTTHSPYMLSTQNDGIHRIRAVDKDSSGYTYIYKTAYDANLSPESQADTLAPIANAIGMNLHDTFGPSKDKLNIIIEGVSDYIYIHTMAKKLGFDFSRYSLIPSVGATNCVNLCAILHGWGCPFFAIFDYDKEGVTKGGEVLRQKFSFELYRRYCYVKAITQEDMDRKTYIAEPYRIEELVTQDEIDRFIEEKGIMKKIDKTLLAKLFSNAIEDGSYAFGEQCKNNFNALFRKIFDAGVAKYS